MISRKSVHIFILTGSLALIQNQAFASGFRIPELNTSGIATSNAMVANSTDLGAIAYNPASMSFQDSPAFEAGLTQITYDASVDPTGGVHTEGSGEDTFLAPNFLLLVPGDKTSFGLVVNSPFGLETEWPDNTFPQFGGVDLVEPSTSRLKMFNVNPNLSFKIDSNTSFGVGLDLFDVQELVFNTYGGEVTGKGNGIGWNIGFQKKFGKFNLGAAYRSSVSTDVNGSASKTVAATSSVEFPDIFQVGVFYQATSKFAVEFDLDRTGWSSFDSLTINAGGILTSTSVNNWEDSWAYRLGFIYQVTPSTKLMFGYSMDQTPQPDEYFSARIPDADRQLFSIGVSHKFSKDWSFQASYLYAAVDTRNVNSTTAYVFGGDANGTTAYNGKYESDVSLIGISFSKKL